MDKSESGGTGISSGFLRTKISLKGNQSQLSLVSPFYGMKPELPLQSQLLGSEDLISLFDLNASYNRYCGPKKPREDLASFLPHVCGAAQINLKADASCSLRQLIEKPPIMGKEINSLSASQIVGFKLAPGPVSDSNRYFDLSDIPPELVGTTLTHSQSLINFEQHDPTKGDDTEGRHSKRMKRSLEEMDDIERKIKKHKSEEKERKKKKKKEKKRKDKEKERKNSEEEQKRNNRKDIATPFF